MNDSRMFFHVAKGILRSEECGHLVEEAEKLGFMPAAVYTDKGGADHYDMTFRKSQRCFLEDADLLDRLWSRVRGIVPLTWDGLVAVGLNPRLRVLKYLPGDEFKLHADGTFRAGNGDMSVLTLLVYLNDGYQGGHTTYVFPEGHRAVIPGIGDVVLQDQNILHYVPPLVSGVKYALRTDVMYRAVGGEVEYKKIVIV